MSRTAEGRPAQMLVVDDDPRGRKLLESYLRAEGYEVRCAPDGPKALTLAKQDPPDVVLLDVMMPHMTGYEVCGILKRDPDTRLCQVMLVTALDSTPDRVEGLDTGADDHLSKPVRRDEFLAKVRALLRARRLLQELEAARHALAARNEELQLKKTLAQSLVHDLKNPLSVILGNLDLLELRASPEMLETIHRSKEGARRMLKMILNLLDVEGLEQGGLQPGIERLDLAAIVTATIDEVRAIAATRGVHLTFEPGEAIRANADPVLLRRVLDNLIANAIAHSPEGGTVSVSARTLPQGIELAVSDEGSGIPEEHRDEVFEKYKRLDLKRAGLSTNRGLGLTFCRLAVEAHGGKIWVDTADGGGACFRVLLPDAGTVGRPRRETAEVSTG